MTILMSQVTSSGSCRWERAKNTECLWPGSHPYFSTLKNTHIFKNGSRTAVPTAPLLMLLRKQAMWHHRPKPVWPGRRAREHFTHTLSSQSCQPESSASHKSFLKTAGMCHK